MFESFLGVSACRMMVCWCGRWTWLKGSNMLHPIEANIEKKLRDVSVLLPTSWKIITIFGVTRWPCFFLKDFSGSKQGWFFVWSWGSCFGSFRACGGAVGWTGKASCWKARKKMTHMTKTRVPGGAETETHWSRKFFVSDVSFLRYLGNLRLMVWRLALWRYRWVVQAPSRCATTNSYVPVTGWLVPFPIRGVIWSPTSISLLFCKENERQRDKS